MRSMACALHTINSNLQIPIVWKISWISKKLPQKCSFSPLCFCVYFIRCWDVTGCELSAVQSVCVRIGVAWQENAPRKAEHHVSVQPRRCSLTSNPSRSDRTRQQRTRPPLPPSAPPRLSQGSGKTPHAQTPTPPRNTLGRPCHAGTGPSSDTKPASNPSCLICAWLTMLSHRGWAKAVARYWEHRKYN